MGTDITATVPDPAELPTENERKAAEKALEYMGLDSRYANDRDRQLIMYLSVLVRTAGSKICVQRQQVAKGYKVSDKLRQSLFQVQDA